MARATSFAESVMDQNEGLAAALAGRYEIEREIGHGGMAVVYLAHDVKHDRSVALKVLRPELAASLGAERFLREIAITASLVHPNILALHDSDEASGFLYYVMPYVDGPTLGQRLKREVQLPLDDVLAIARQVAAALDHAHARGVVHRDIKPDNMLLLGDHVLVADFGLARAISSAASTPLTYPRVVVGTVPYMSPEQCTPGRAVDARSDIYSLGCVVFEMITGVPPFRGATVEATMLHHQTSDPPSLRTERRSCPSTLDDVVRRALAKAPADRFRTAGEFVRALESPRPIPIRYQTSPSVEAFEVTAKTVDDASMAPRAVKRRSWIYGAGAVAVLLVGGYGLWLQRISPPLDDQLVAVAPFDIYDSRLAIWREGFMDILAGSLDGAGALRTVSPTVVVRRWSGNAQVASGLALARGTGARYVVLGRAFQAGDDSVRASIVLLDARSRRERTTIDVRESSQRIDRLADSVAMHLIRELGESVDRHTRLRSLGAGSLPALKAFLLGEHYLRQTQWDSAAAAYEVAVTLDPRFALANWRMKTALWSQSWGPDTVGDAFALAAGRLNHGLAPRESLLITVDSLWASLGATDECVWHRMRRLGLTLDEAARRYPDDPWIWYKVGEARFHLPLGLDYSMSENLEAFDRAISIDSGFALAYVTHAVELALILHGPERARRYTKGYRLAALPGVEDSAATLTEYFLDSARARLPEAKRILEAASADVLYRVAATLDMWFDAEETAVQVAHELSRARRGSSRFLDRRTVQLRLARILAVRGHLRESLDELQKAGPLLAPDDETIELFADLARFGAVSPTIADSVFRAWTKHSARGVIFALPWWASRHDTAALHRAADVFGDSTFRSAPRPLRTYGRIAVNAYMSMSRGDTLLAKQKFAQLTDSLCADCYLDWFSRAQLSLAGGDFTAARRQLERVQTYAWSVPSYPYALLYIGRVADRMGEPEVATKSYRVVTAAWHRADDLLRPYVAEATARLARLEK
jgi:serine/threonine-protein kinase